MITTYRPDNIEHLPVKEGEDVTVIARSGAVTYAMDAFARVGWVPNEHLAFDLEGLPEVDGIEGARAHCASPALLELRDTRRARLDMELAEAAVLRRTTIKLREEVKARAAMNVDEGYRLDTTPQPTPLNGQEATDLHRPAVESETVTALRQRLADLEHQAAELRRMQDRDGLGSVEDKGTESCSSAAG